MNSDKPICLFWSNRNFLVPPKKSTRYSRFQSWEITLSLAFCIFCSSSTRWFLSSISIIFYVLLCSVTQGPNLFWLTLQKTLLGNWCQRGRESSHQSLIPPSRRESNTEERHPFQEKDPSCLIIKEERSYMSLEGTYMFILCFMFALLCFSFLFPIFSQYPL